MDNPLIVNDYIVKLIGLVSDFPIKKNKNANYFFTANGFTRDLFPTQQDGSKNTASENFLKDYFYPSFRKMMFLQSDNSSNERYLNRLPHNVNLLVKGKTLPIQVSNIEVFLFTGYVGLFSIDLKMDKENITLYDMEDLLNAVRYFQTPTDEGIEWQAWISKYLLCGTTLRGDGIQSDEYSGSKFKLYTIIDLGEQYNTEAHLYDMATVSKVGTAAGNHVNSPDDNYYHALMQNKIAIFKNWQALCLFDTFTCLGSGQLVNGRIAWDYTYFRIYIYRLFIKYNLYKYNSTIYEGKNHLGLKNEFQQFLNNYNISHISYNFLGNELYRKIGEALELDVELASFEKRITQMTELLIQEKQNNTNALLTYLAILSGISSLLAIPPSPCILLTDMGIGDAAYNKISAFLSLICISSIFYFLKGYIIAFFKWIRRK